MSKFYYKAKDNNDKLTTGHIMASSISDAAVKLEKDGLVVLELNEEAQLTGNVSKLENVHEVSSNSMFKIKEKIEFFNALYFMYTSGLSVQQIFGSIYSQSKNPNIRGLCAKVVKKIERGRTLEEAFQGCQNALGVAYTSLIVAGEHSGKLDEVLEDIIKNLNREEEIKNNLISSFAYPVCILALALFVFLLFEFCLLKIYASMGQGITYCAMKTIFITAMIKIAIIYAVIIGACIFLYKNKALQRKIMDFICAMPFMSKIVKSYNFANFFSVMGLSYMAGIPAYRAVELANSVVSIKRIKMNISNAVKMISKGCEVTTAFGVAKVFSSFAMSQISAGEKSGELDKMCAIVSNSYEKELETSLSVMMKLMQPISLGLIAIIVGYVLYRAYTTYYAALLNSLYY